jgi:hypothetical protein
MVRYPEAGCAGKRATETRVQPVICTSAIEDGLVGKPSGVCPREAYRDFETPERSLGWLVIKPATQPTSAYAFVLRSANNHQRGLKP